jgi:hypothetical protein
MYSEVQICIEIDIVWAVQHRPVGRLRRVEGRWLPFGSLSLCGVGVCVSVWLCLCLSVHVGVGVGVWVFPLAPSLLPPVVGAPRMALVVLTPS